MDSRDILLIFLVNFCLVECAVTRIAKLEQIKDWKKQLSQVLDAENEELQVLQNLIEGSESNEELQKLPTPKPIESENDHGAVSLESDTAIQNNHDSITFLRDRHVLTKLEENSQRMDSMVVFLSDLKEILTESIGAQEKKMRLENEVVELREEIEFLRKEIQTVKKQQMRLNLNINEPSLEHTIKNDEITIQWLKGSNEELRNEMKDLLKTCNATTLLHLQQSINQQTKRQHSDLFSIQKEIEGIKLVQLKQEEKITEAKGNIGSMRSWQAKMGQKIADGHPNSVERGSSNDALNTEEQFLTEALKDSSEFAPKYGRHSKKLKTQLHQIHKITKILAKDHNLINKRLSDLEKAAHLSQDASMAQIKQQKPESYPEMEQRVYTVEDSLQQVTLTLQTLGDKVNGVNGFQEANTQLFATLEGLEKQYDERLTEMQTNLAKLEAAVSVVNNTNMDLQEQQTHNSRMMKSMKKEVVQTGNQLQKNSLRLASLETQLLQWASQKCSVEDTMSIQNIRIASLESLVRHVKKDIRESS